MQTLTGDTQRSSSDTDAADVSLAAAGDAQAFERLYRRHVARIHSLARRMIGAESADEITQEVFVRAWEKLRSFRGEGAFGGWLRRVALNVLLARRRALAAERQRSAPPPAHESVAARAPLVTPDLAIDFENAIEELPGGARQVFVQHDIEGYTHEEIGGMLGIATGTSKSQLHRACMLLRSYFER
ncbi:MAG: RNA polymerase sigma factor [Longimicrobiaceae bacterium]